MARDLTPPASREPMSALPPTARETLQMESGFGLIRDSMDILVAAGLSEEAARAALKKMQGKGIFLTRGAPI